MTTTAISSQMFSLSENTFCAVDIFLWSYLWDSRAGPVQCPAGFLFLDGFWLGFLLCVDSSIWDVIWHDLWPLSQSVAPAWCLACLRDNQSLISSTRFLSLFLYFILPFPLSLFLSYPSLLLSSPSLFLSPLTLFYLFLCSPLFLSFSLSLFSPLSLLPSLSLFLFFSFSLSLFHLFLSFPLSLLLSSPSLLLSFSLWSLWSLSLLPSKSFRDRSAVLP